jgi:hypothetical protein
MWKEKTTTPTLKVTEDLAALWKVAAEEEGHPSVAPWLRFLAQGKVKELGVTLPEKTLDWKRGVFVVKLYGQVPEWRGPTEVKGIIAGPFGIFRGSSLGCYSWNSSFTLVLVPCQTAFATFDRQIDCKDLARRLIPLKLDWYATEPSEVSGPGVPVVREILQLFKRREHDREESRRTKRI